MSATVVEVHDDAATLAAAVAGALLHRLVEAQAAGGCPHVALTGGSIAAAVHREVGRLASESGVDWSRVHLWWGDERFVDAGSPDRNASGARRVFEEAGVPPSHVHEVPAVGEADSVQDAAGRYAATLAETGPDELEIVLLGVGEDGHVASLFPGHRALGVLDQPVAGVADSPKPPSQRVTLTLPRLNRARAVWFVASGEGKAPAVSRALAEHAGTQHPPPDPHDVPAAGVHGREETVWFLDRPAASLL